MIAIGILGHGDLPAGIISALELIVGEQKHVFGVSLQQGDSPETFQQNLDKEMSRFDDGKFLFLVDLKGGTPSNIAARLTSENHYCVSGVNLPMVLEIVMDSEADSLPELAAKATTIGTDSITNISEELKKLMK